MSELTDQAMYLRGVEKKLVRQDRKLEILEAEQERQRRVLAGLESAEKNIYRLLDVLREDITAQFVRLRTDLRLPK